MVDHVMHSTARGCLNPMIRVEFGRCRRFYRYIIPVSQEAEW